MSDIGESYRGETLDFNVDSEVFSTDATEKVKELYAIKCVVGLKNREG